MSSAYQELACETTPLGELVLRRRRVLSLDGEVVHEILLDGAFLMSSVVNDSERALADLALARLDRDPRHVMVGGLGLGYTAHAALRHPGVERVTVVERLAAVIDWHRRGLVPLAGELAADPRFRVVEGDFFRVIGSPAQGDEPDELDAILVDIDHSPDALLDPSHQGFYREEGLRMVAGRLAPGGVLGIWSADRAGPEFLVRLQSVLTGVTVKEVDFFHPLVAERVSDWIYVGQRPA